jgi:hypothetical protein
MFEIKKRKNSMEDNALNIKQNKTDMNFKWNFLNREKLLGRASIKYKSHLDAPFKML